MVPVTQLDEVLAVLDRRKVRYWVDSDAISVDNEPAITVINFGRSGDARLIQSHSRRGRLDGRNRAMPLSDDIRGSGRSQVLGRVDEAREFYVHSRQAWRLVQQHARKGRPVGIVDLATKAAVCPLRIWSRVLRGTSTVQLADVYLRNPFEPLGGLVIGPDPALADQPFRKIIDLNFDPVDGPTPRQQTRGSSDPDYLDCCT